MDDALGCPKRMVFGPCGGVRDDGGCNEFPGEAEVRELLAAAGFRLAV